MDQIDKPQIPEKRPELSPKKESLVKEPELRHDFHGARRSKIDPALMTVLQHEAHKLRIFKLTMGLTIIAVVIGVIIALIAYFRKMDSDSAYAAEQTSKLDQYEKDIKSFTAAGKHYEAAKLAVRATRLAESMLEFGITHQRRELEQDMEKRIPGYLDVVKDSDPWADGKNFVTATAMLDMVYIPAGSFEMGASERPLDQGKPAEQPQIKVRISKPFWIARKEIDVWQIRKLIPAFKIPEWNHMKMDALNYPAGRVTWDQAMFYCQKLTADEKELGRIPEGYEYRLPTEAEWEYACRAGSNTVYYWGNSFGNDGAKYANSLDRKAGTRFGWQTRGEVGIAAKDPFPAMAPCGSFQPNAWGLYDMAGNVSEWCYDYYNPHFYSVLKDMPPSRIDPRNDYPIPVAYKQFRPFDAGSITREIPCKSVRGGNWGNLPSMMRSAARDFMPQNEPNNGVGFRPVLAPVIQSKISNVTRVD